MRKTAFFIVFIICVGVLIYFYHQGVFVGNGMSTLLGRNVEKQSLVTDSGILTQNKRLIQQLYQAIEANDQAKIKQFFSNNYSIINYGSIYDHSYENAANKKSYIESTPSMIANTVYLHKAFSNVKITISDMIAEGEKLFVNVRIMGNQTGQWMGYAPTGKKLVLHLFVIYTIENNKIVKVVEMHNDLNVMQQLGYMPVK